MSMCAKILLYFHVNALFKFIIGTGSLHYQCAWIILFHAML